MGKIYKVCAAASGKDPKNLQEALKTANGQQSLTVPSSALVLSVEGGTVEAVPGGKHEKTV